MLDILGVLVEVRAVFTSQPLFPYNSSLAPSLGCAFLQVAREAIIPGGISHIKRAGMLVVPLRGLKSWVSLVPLRVFKAKYLYLHTTRYLLGVATVN